MNFIFLTVKNLYLIHVLFKNSIFFFEIFLQYYTHFFTILLKNTKVTHDWN